MADDPEKHWCSGGAHWVLDRPISCTQGDLDGPTWTDSWCLRCAVLHVHYGDYMKCDVKAHIEKTVDAPEPIPIPFFGDEDVPLGVKLRLWQEANGREANWDGALWTRDQSHAYAKDHQP